MLLLPAQPDGPVNDYAKALTPVQASRLNAQLRSYEKGTSRQIAVAIFRSLEGESLEDVSIRLAEKWKIGGKTSNDGVLLTVFLDDHKLRIEVGYGLEDKLTDAMSARIIRDVMAPRLKKNDLFGALTSGVAAIDTVIGGEKHAEGQPPTASDGRGVPVSMVVLTLIVIVVSIVNASRRGGFRGSFLGGGGWSSTRSGWSSGGGSGWSGGGGSFGGGGSSGSW